MSGFRFYKIYNILRTVYLFLMPKGTKRYQISHSILSMVLKHLRLYNVAYREWIHQNDQLSEKDINKIQAGIDEMVSKPFISVVMPVYNPKLRYLNQAIQSVINQVYPYWELCISDDASTDPRVPALLKTYAQNDPRIKLVIRKENGHISAASNSALKLATQDFIALLDHDDLLHPLALYYIAQTINEHPDSEVIYSDEDKTTKRGKRLDPYFKPEFNYELLLSHNMVSHLGVYRTSTVRKVGGFRKGLEGSQDYDLLLRVLEQINPRNIHHIPLPLYHWRISRLSVAEDINIKPYAIESAKRAILEHLQRLSVNADVNFLPEVAAYNVEYKPPDPSPAVTLLIIPKASSPSIIKMLRSIIVNTTLENYHVFVCLPKSSAKLILTDDVLRDSRIKNIEMDFNEDTPFVDKIKECIKLVSDDYICLLDESLTGFKPGWLYMLLGQAVQSGVGAVAPKLLLPNEITYSNGIILQPNGTIYHLSNGEHYSINGYFGWAKIRRGYSALSEKCLLFNREAYHSVNGFDDDIDDPLFASIDFCLQLRAKNLRNILCPDVVLYININKHYNLKQDNFSNKKAPAYLYNKWEQWFRVDPAFNPNLEVDNRRILPRVIKSE